MNLSLKLVHSYSVYLQVYTKKLKIYEYCLLMILAWPGMSMFYLHVVSFIYNILITCTYQRYTYDMYIVKVYL